MPLGRLLFFSLITALILLSCTACAWRRGGQEHYFGPVMFRSQEPPAGAARITDVIRFGLLLEGGSQWGIALGANRRIAVAPVEVCGPGTPVSGITVFGLLTAAGEEWTFSPFYLRIMDAPAAAFWSRTSYGAEVTAGPEIAAISLGAMSRTLFVPAVDSLSRLVFDDSRPLATKLSTCRDVSDWTFTHFER